MNNKKTFLVLLVLVFALVFTLSACNGDAVTISSLTLNKKEVTLEVGATETLTATVTVTPDTAANKAVTWTSDKPSVATVDANGKITAVGVGEAVITVTSVKDADKTATVAVTVKPASTATISLDGETGHTNDKYGNTDLVLGEDLKVTGTLKYHETDPTGMGFADYDHHFLVFKIAGLPEAGAEVTIKGLADEVESSTTYTFTSASDVVIWGVEANENIEITVNYGGEYAPMVYKLDLSGVTLAEKEVAKSIATIDKATLPTEDAFAWANEFDKSNWSGLTVTGSLDYVAEEVSVGFTGETHFLTFAVEVPADVASLTNATVAITGLRGAEAVTNNYTGGQFEAYNDGQALLVVWGVEDGEDEITIVVDWDGDSKDYNATTYILDLKDLALNPAPVVNGTKGYSTIQAAITAATAGDTIEVAAGTYNEALSIDKDLTLQGAIEAILTGGTTITGGNVTIAGFTINTKGILASGGTDLTIQNNIFSNIQTAMEGSPGGSVIGLDVTSASGSIEINNNEFSNIGKENDTGTAIRMVGLSGATTITGNTIQGVTKNGINIYNYPSAVNLTITGNIIADWDSDHDNYDIGGRAIRIDFNSKTGLATINNNTLTPPIYTGEQTPVDPEYVKITRSTNITNDFDWGSVELEKIVVE